VSLTRKAFFTVAWQVRSCALIASALELQASIASAARANVKIIFEAFCGTRIGVIYFLLPFADSALADNSPKFLLLICKFRLSKWKRLKISGASTIPINWEGLLDEPPSGEVVS
jgi:hypothetical protein